jgi:hypothetical protein
MSGVDGGPTEPRRRTGPTLSALLALTFVLATLPGLVLAGSSAVAATAPPAPGDVRIRLEQLLGQHATLAVRLTRAGLREDPDLAQAADDALGTNTADLRGLVEGALGPATGAEFAQLWTAHITQVFGYARAIAKDDKGSAGREQQQLERSVQGLAGFFARATRGGVSADAVRSTLQQHVDAVLGQVDAYARGDYTEAYAVQRQGYARIFSVGTTLAAGMAGGGRVAADFGSPQRQLQSRLGRLFGEHSELAVDVVRSGLAGRPDFPAATSALDGNTADVTAAVEAVLGPQAARRFATVWADHIDSLVAYAAATADADATGKSAALDGLRTSAAALARFLTEATGNRLDGPRLAASFTAHNAMLVDQVDAYSARDYAAAHALSYDGYQDMVVLAGQVAGALGSTVAARTPRGGAQTGLGGMAALVGRT